MTAMFRISKDLELRHGATFFSFSRFLDGRRSVQLENQDSGEYTKLSVEELMRRIYSKEFVPVGGSQPVLTLDDESAADTIVDVECLPLEHRILLLLRFALIKALKRAGVTRGQTREIAELLPALIPKVYKRVVDDHPGAGPIRFNPAPSTIQRLWQRYELAGGNYTALVSGDTRN